jgi:hypothetical protein
MLYRSQKHHRLGKTLSRSEKGCVACSQPIAKSATKCHHCTADQGWLRYVGITTLLIGIELTVLTIYVQPPVKDLFDAKKAELSVALLESDMLQTTVMLSNTGSRPAALDGIELTSSDNTTYFLHSELDKQLIEPGKAYILHAKNGTAIPEPLSPEVLTVLAHRKITLNANCKLVLKIIQMQAIKEYVNFSYPCRSPKSLP